MEKTADPRQSPSPFVKRLMHLMTKADKPVGLQKDRGDRDLIRKVELDPREKEEGGYLKGNAGRWEVEKKRVRAWEPSEALG